IYWVGLLQADSIVYAANLTAVVQYAIRIMMSFMMLAMLFVMLPRAAVSAARIDAVLNAAISIPDTGTDTEIPTGEIVFDSVCFRFGRADENVLNNLSFTLKPGETTAIIGGTGSGKSTVLNLIMRFYAPSAGQITVGGKDIAALSQRALRAKIGFVPQTAVLTSGTILDNIRFGGGAELTEAQAAAACKVAQADKFIGELPEGYQSYVSQGGANFSGGQKQRLSIARAIAKNPDIYLFDDCLSALDSKTDASLRAALKEVTEDSTVVIVAQRVSSIMNADKIIVLSNGEIRGTGKHAQLLENCPEYAEIVHSQLNE
ncbi:MAG: ABC transporter ATP-binding protein/permease, partial [Firmicutes bacterium]|nr:ABC transporter ATP-binding protein/permease [Bacillota bacterium]